MGELVLASDAEREDCAARLREAAVEGRFDVLELDQRLGVAYAARTRAELAKVTADLPEPDGDPVASPRRAAGHWRRVVVALTATTNALLIGLWVGDVGAMRDPVLFGSDFDLPWPLIPALASAGVTAAVAWRHRRGERTTPRLPRAIA